MKTKVQPLNAKPMPLSYQKCAFSTNKHDSQLNHIGKVSAEVTTTRHSLLPPAVTVHYSKCSLCHHIDYYNHMNLVSLNLYSCLAFVSQSFVSWLCLTMYQSQGLPRVLFPPAQVAQGGYAEPSGPVTAWLRGLQFLTSCSAA